MRDRAFVMAIPDPATHFNESFRSGGGGYFVGNNIFNRLVIVDVFDEARISPDLAQRWDILDDGRTYRFHLRRDVRWHDGAPLVADDVRHTYLTALERGYAAAVWLTDLEDVVVSDPHTVELRLREPNSGFLAQLGIFVATHILPSHLYAGTNWANNPTNAKPVGTGPYRFAGRDRDDAVRVVANSDYFRGRPALDEVEFRVMSYGEGVDALVDGAVDFLAQYPPCAALDDFEAMPGVAVSQSPGNAICHMSFNLDRTPWSDLRVRQALAMAVDRDLLTASLCARAPAVPFAYLPRIAWAFEPAARMPDYNPQRSAELLDQAGISPDSIGSRGRIRIVCRDFFHFYAAAAEFVGEELHKLGFEVRVDHLTPARFASEVAESRDFDLYVDGLDIGPDPSFLETVFASTGRSNLTRYSNPKFDELLKRGKAAVERVERAPAYKQAQLLLAQDLPRVHLAQHDPHMGHRSKWRGWSWDRPARGTLPFWSLERVSDTLG